MLFFTSAYAFFFFFLPFIIKQGFYEASSALENRNYSRCKKKNLAYMEVTVFLENQIYPAKITGRQIERQLSVDIKII